LTTTLFESAPGLCLVLDRTFRSVAVNDAYLDATMTKRSEILGRNIFDAFPDDPEDLEATGVASLRASLERVRDRCEADTIAVQKYDIRRPPEEGGGFEVRYWSPCNSPVRDEYKRVKYTIHRVEDVTDFVRLHERESEQAREIVRARELQHTNEKLRAANSARNEFVSITAEATAVRPLIDDAIDLTCPLAESMDAVIHDPELGGRQRLRVRCERPGDRGDPRAGSARSADPGDARPSRAGSRPRDRPHLILLDLHLPDLSGDQVLAASRKDEATARLSRVAPAPRAPRRAPRAP
jgi:CheY-like chemotaxis protein